MITEEELKERIALFDHNFSFSSEDTKALMRKFFAYMTICTRSYYLSMTPMQEIPNQESLKLLEEFTKGDDLLRWVNLFNKVLDDAVQNGLDLKTLLMKYNDLELIVKLDLGFQI